MWKLCVLAAALCLASCADWVLDKDRTQAGYFVAREGALPDDVFHEKSLRERVEGIHADFEKDRRYYGLPAGVKVSTDEIRIQTKEGMGGETMGSLYAAGGLRSGLGGIEPYSTDLTLTVDRSKFRRPGVGRSVLDSTLAHELAHAWFAKRFPLVYVSAQYVDVVEGQAVFAQYRWMARNYPQISEARFEEHHPSSYRGYYHAFKQKFTKGGAVDWQRIQSLEDQLKSRLVRTGSLNAAAH
ncbi:hypothetical protein [Akkermansia glycaniphila]|uniref:Uncharacterized protein n=1 Tax=Akkermansia glycaniphila TaxID=1679444 RepID=A0A1H6LRI7_9BACT|nr:hypothetical protein [Akkermansia glycaniphila]MBT9450604.1 hypothetical protein [Akkermansia glycaniphila]SEH91321.1 Hypothetical protein PYTT_1664 [Akkermansia glycaniphila]